MHLLLYKVGNTFYCHVQITQEHVTKHIHSVKTVEYLLPFV